ncbi:MAG: NAD(P)H-hydrate dehydratase [Marinilabiliaceae bacterium]|nr:NAD(P)H-hydrate dehydratase [Marinilabiliaceae bacterium]
MKKMFVPIYKTDEIRKIDSLTCEFQNISSLELMDRASQCLSQWILNNIDSPSDRCYFIFCGPGGNGGDGLGIAYYLASKGVRIKVFLYAQSTEHCSRDNKAMQLRLATIGIGVELNEQNVRPESDHDIAIDALFGFGLNRPLVGDVAKAAEAIQLFSECISIDMPSGLLSAPPYSPGPGDVVVTATHTLAVQLPKMPYFLPETIDYVGNLHFVDISLVDTIEELERVSVMTDSVLVSPERRKSSYKGEFGHVSLYAGSYGMMGAAQLAAKACLRSGAGLLTCIVPQCGYEIMQISVPEAMVMTCSGKSLDTSVPYNRKTTVLAVGPGLGRNQETTDAVKSIIEYANQQRLPIVIDADAIWHLKRLIDSSNIVLTNAVLTPHVGEFDHLTHRHESHWERLQTALEFARMYDCYVVLKSCKTAVITPQGDFIFCPAGNPGMATAGSGDVLTGIVAGSVAQWGLNQLSVCRAVMRHSTAGDMALKSLKQGCKSLIASDIIAFMS